ncbi:MAG: HNH endonuclease [Chloroflexi bacterium]|nr:HNH endonuclease [Chloroflexota bacterium]
MEPVTLAAIIGAISLVVKSTHEGRERATNVLRTWDDGLRRSKGLAGKRVSIPPHVRQAILTLRGRRCTYGGVFSDCDGSLHVDHVRSLTDGGTNYSENLQVVCQKHNLSKGRKSDLEFR